MGREVNRWCPKWARTKRGNRPVRKERNSVWALNDSMRMSPVFFQARCSLLKDIKAFMFSTGTLGGFFPSKAIWVISLPVIISQSAGQFLTGFALQ
jgi:hypothetical protein